MFSVEVIWRSTGKPANGETLSAQGRTEGQRPPVYLDSLGYGVESGILVYRSSAVHMGQRRGRSP